jgi:hypothetical protein
VNSETAEKLKLAFQEFESDEDMYCCVLYGLGRDEDMYCCVLYGLGRDEDMYCCVLYGLGRD